MVRLLCLMTPLIQAQRGEIAAEPVHFDTDSGMLRVDNGATASLSPYISDFITDLEPDPHHVIQGVGGTLDGIMTGTLKFMIEDDEGRVHAIVLPNSKYVPGAHCRLLSPQHWAQQKGDDHPMVDGTWCATYATREICYWDQRKFKRTMKLDRRGSNVATIRTAPGYNKYQAFCAQVGAQGDEESDLLAYEAPMVSDEENSEDEDENSTGGDEEAMQPQRERPLVTDFNLQGLEDATAPAIIEDEEDSMPQDATADFLRWHHRLGHISPRKIRLLAHKGILPRQLARCKVPLCTSCLFGKATRRPWRSKSPHNQVGQARTITKPGECVSIDQLESSTPGLIAQLRGMPTKLRYRVATVFVDHYSRLSYVHLQKSTSAEETIQAKEAFERFAASHGTKVLHYHADNGIFADNKFKEHVFRNGQTLSFCGVNAHFQNGIAERKIRELQEHARTMLIHANRRWPSAVNTNLWPYALRMANDILNATPSVKGEEAPLNLFAQTTIATNPKHWYPFGCPVYALDNDLQAGKKIDKWEERARVGIYIGHSPAHARTVALVLSLQTGLTSPQFHVRMDPTFQTLRKAFDGRPPVSLWQQKCHFVKNDRSDTEIRTETQQRAQDSAKGSKESATAPGAQPPAEENSAGNGTAPRQVEFADNVPMEDTGQHPPNEDEGNEVEPPIEPLPPLQETQENVGTRRSARERRPTQRLIEMYAAELQAAHATFEAYEIFATPEHEVQEIFHPLEAFAASADPDTMYLHQAMRQPDRDKFIAAMVKEVDMQTSNGNWSIVQRSQVPEGATVLPAVWSMKRKRKIATGEIYKWKARLNIDGSRQTKGVNYWDTYAPVASWSTVRLILTMSVIKGWKSRQIDYVQAYTQADVEIDHLYMKIPRGFEVSSDDAQEEHVLKIHKNIYGQKQAGRVWNKHLVSKLETAGFTQSSTDACVFYKGNCIYVLYTDDSILCGPDDAELDQIVQDLRNTGLDLTVEGDIGDFLGVKITTQPNGAILMTQPHLIDNILRDLRLDKDNVATKETPAPVSTILTKHSASEAFDGYFDYRSVIGKLNYLEKSTRPDIAHALHQCARFAASPKKEHGKAIIWLGRYLAGTKDKGLIFLPKEQSFDCYVDADFAGNWDYKEAPDDPDTARSRTGYVINYAGCPITWASKLQTQMALSTTEAEYIALSMALRETIPLMELIQEMQTKGFDCTATKPTVHCRVFEDNSGALEIATVHKYRPRTKHINNQYHHFRQYVEQGKISIKAISTELQRADMLTKSVSVSLLRRHRESIMGW